jgi:hypothetical protein
VGYDETRLMDSGRVVGPEGRHEKIMIHCCRREPHQYKITEIYD